jgi:hypothetical protein
MMTPAELHAKYGWPPRLVMYLACVYTGRSRWALARAARSGVLPVAGRNGRAMVFDREALDAFMVGSSTESAFGNEAPAKSTAKRTAVGAKRFASANGSEAALVRLRAIAGGKR